MPAFSAVESGVWGEAGFMVEGVVYDDEAAEEGPGLGEGREWLAAAWDGGADGGGIRLLAGGLLEKAIAGVCACEIVS